MSRLGLALTIAVAIASGAIAPLAEAAPTASSTADAIWLFLLGAATALAGSRAHPATVIVLLALAGLTVTSGWLQLAVALGLAVLVLLAATGLAATHRLVIPNGVSAAIGINVLVRADQPLGSDLMTLAAAVLVVATVMVSALVRSPRRARRFALAGLGAVVAITTVVAGLAAIAVLGARSDLEDGVAAAREGLDLATAGRTDADSIATANARFDTAETLLRRGHRTLARSWVRPAMGLPIVGPNLHATTELAATAIDVASTATEVSAAADPARFTVTDARVDLSLVVDTRPHLLEARRSLTDALAVVDRVESPWLLSPLTSRIDTLTEAAAEALPTLDDLIAIADLAPPMLGHDSPRLYLILFTTPAETRGIGGFVGHWGVIAADEGSLDLIDSGRLSELGDPPGTHDRRLVAPQEYLDRYYRYHVDSYPVNITASPDLPTVGEVALDLFPQLGMPRVDGVILVDPSAVAALATITGPLHIPSREGELTAATLEEFLWLDQYVEFAGDDRVDALGELIDAVFGALTTSSLDPNQVIEALGPMVADKRLMVWSADPDEAAILARFGLDGAFPIVEAGIDLLSVRTANTNGNKIDTFLQRDIRYQATVDPTTGSLTGTVTVTLTNHATDDPNLPGYVLGNFYDFPRATNYQWVTLYTPHELDALKVDGRPVEPESMPEFGVLTHALYVDIPPQGQVTITFELSGHVAPDYQLVWSGQPTVRPDRLRVDVDTGSGNLTVGDDEVGDQVAQDLTFTTGS